MTAEVLRHMLENYDAAACFTFNRGIEREALRTNPDGTLALTPHPEALGAKLTHPLITTDFSEAQLELITPVHPSVSDVMSNLEQIHQWTDQQLGQERLWAGSMPCILPAELEIPLANYGNSNLGRLKTTYRHGLGLRYNRTMQTICAVHYNFSFSMEFFTALSQSQTLQGQASQLNDAAFRSEKYFGLMRNFRQLSWLPAYLFGASPAVDASFLRDDDHHLNRLSASTFHKPHATSLRSGGLGYQSATQSTLLNICYNSLDNYTGTLRRGITEHHRPYAELGQQSNTLFPQVNDNILQSEAEFYASVRAKATPPPGENFLNYLDTVGVEYIEVRLLDANPYLPLGVDNAQLHFMDLLLLHCMLEPSSLHGDDLCAEVAENFQRATQEGRKPGLLLRLEGRAVALSTWASEVFDQLRPLAEFLDALSDGIAYQNSLDALKIRINDPETTPSGQLITQLLDQNLSLIDCLQGLSDQHRGDYQKTALPEDQRLYFDRVATDSKQTFDQIPDHSDEDFRHYLAHQQQTYQKPS